MRFYTSWRGKVALATAIVLFSLGVSGCFQTADASTTAVPDNSTNTTSSDTASQVPQPSPTLLPSITPLSVAQVQPTPDNSGQLPPDTGNNGLPNNGQPDNSGQILPGGPEATQTSVQSTLFAQATAILVGVTQTAGVEQTMTATAMGTGMPGDQGAQPQPNQGQPAQPNPGQPVQPNQVVPTATPVGQPGVAGSGAAGPIDPNCIYTIVEGDRIFRIALRFNLSSETVSRVNGIVNPELISVNQKLRIPAPGCAPAPTATPTVNPNITPTPIPGPGTPTAVVPGPNARTYVVQAGDTLFAISVRMGAKISAIAQANNIQNINLIYVGQTLIIP